MVSNRMPLRATSRRTNLPTECRGTRSGEPKDQKLVYAARISLDRTQMQDEENRVNLSPGMAVSGSCAIISHLLSPLFKYRQESLRERPGVAICTITQRTA
jgi:hemolysin D